MTGTATWPETFPEAFADAAALEDFMTTPDAALVDDLAGVEGDIAILGVGGKMGPTLARLAKRAAPEKRILGVARFSEPGLEARLNGWGVETLRADLLERESVEALPRLPNVVFMAGRKFGSAGDLALTWAMNAHVPTLVAETFRDSRIVAFSSGNVYPFADIRHGGASEHTPPRATGEYAQSCLARERLFEHFSARFGTPGRLLRLNYAIDMRYGVLWDVATKVRDGAEIDLTTGHVNVIWQGDANAFALRCLAHCTRPTSPLNVTGPETISIRALAHAFGRRLGTAPRLAGAESDRAWLNDAGACHRLMGYPRVPLARMIDWVADWVGRGMESLDKPTAYDSRDGTF